VGSTDILREADQEEILILKEAETMAAQLTLSNSKKNRKTAPEAIKRRVLSLKKRCMVEDITEVAAAMVAVETEDMVAVVDIETAVKEVTEEDTEIVVVNMTEAVTEAMEAVVAIKIQVLKCLQFKKVKIPTCYQIISVLIQINNMEIFTFTRLILVFSMTLEMLTWVLSSQFKMN
jgi:hypothetical protein